MFKVVMVISIISLVFVGFGALIVCDLINKYFNNKDD